MSLDFVQSYAPTPSRSAWRVSPNAYVPRRETFFTPRNEVLSAGPTMSRLPGNADRKSMETAMLHENATREAHRRPVANGQLPPGVNLIMDFPRMRGPGSRPSSVIDARFLGTRQESDVLPTIGVAHHHHHRVPQTQPRGISLDSRGGQMAERGAFGTMHSTVSSSHYSTAASIAPASSTNSQREVDDRDFVPMLTNARTGGLWQSTIDQQTDHASRDREIQYGLFGVNKGVKNVRFASDPSTFATLSDHNASEVREGTLTTSGPATKRRRIGASVTSMSADQQKNDHVERHRDVHSVTAGANSGVFGKIKSGVHALARQLFVSSNHRPNDEREKMQNMFTQGRRHIKRSASAHRVDVAASDHVSTDRDHLATIQHSYKTNTRFGNTGKSSLRVEQTASNHAEKQREHAAQPVASYAISKLSKNMSHGAVSDQASSDRNKVPRESVQAEMPSFSRAYKLHNKGSSSVASSAVPLLTNKNDEKMREPVVHEMPSNTRAMRLHNKGSGNSAAIAHLLTNKKDEKLRESMVYEMPAVAGTLKLQNKGSSSAAMLPSLTNKKTEDTREPVLGLLHGGAVSKTKSALNHIAVPFAIEQEHQARDVNVVTFSNSSAPSQRLQTRHAPPLKQAGRVSSHMDSMAPLVTSSSISGAARTTPGLVLADDTRVSRGSTFSGTGNALPQHTPIKTPLRLGPGTVTRAVRETAAQKADSLVLAVASYGSLLRKPNVSGVHEQRGSRSASLPGDVPRLAPMLKF